MIEIKDDFLLKNSLDLDLILKILNLKNFVWELKKKHTIYIYRSYREKSNF